MVPFVIEGLSGIPLDPRTAQGSGSRRGEGPRAKRPEESVTFEGGRLLREIEARKEALLARPFLRDDRVAAAREELASGGGGDAAALDEAAEKMLGGDAAEEIDLRNL